MSRGLGIDIVDGDVVLILKRNLRRDLFLDDFFEKSLFHRQPLSSFAVLIQTCRSRGPSNSQRKIPCQRPSISFPPSTRTVTLFPTQAVLTWASLFPSSC